MLGADFVECNEHGGVNSAIDVEKGAGYAVYVRDAVFINCRCGHRVGRVLHLESIHRREPFFGRVLRAHWYRVLEVHQRLADGIRHGDVDVTVRVVTIDGKAAVIASRRVGCDGKIFRRAPRRWVALLAEKNLMPKSSTARVEVVGRLEWVQRSGVCATGAYPWGWRLRTRRL